MQEDAHSLNRSAFNARLKQSNATHNSVTVTNHDNSISLMTSNITANTAKKQFG